MLSAAVAKLLDEARAMLRTGLHPDGQRAVGPGLRARLPRLIAYLTCAVAADRQVRP